MQLLSWLLLATTAVAQPSATLVVDCVDPQAGGFVNCTPTPTATPGPACTNDPIFGQCPTPHTLRVCASEFPGYLCDGVGTQDLLYYGGVVLVPPAATGQFILIPGVIAFDDLPAGCYVVHAAGNQCTPFGCWADTRVIVGDAGLDVQIPVADGTPPPAPTCPLTPTVTPTPTAVPDVPSDSSGCQMTAGRQHAWVLVVPVVLVLLACRRRTP